MPVSRYDKYFGGQRGSAEKALKSMNRTYGPKGGEHVFYGTIAKREKKARAAKRWRW